MTKGYELRLRDIVDVVYRRRQWVLRALLIGLGLGAMAALVVPPVYRASTIITQDKVPPEVVLNQPAFGPTDPNAEAQAMSPDLSTLAELVRSDTVLQGAQARLAPTLGAQLASVVLTTVRVNPLHQTQLLVISVANRNPRVAADAANAVTASLIDMDLRARRLRAAQLRQAIEQQLTVAAPKLRAREEALAAFKSQHGDVAVQDQTVQSLNRLGQLQAELVDVRTLRQETQARITASRARLASQSQVAPTQWIPSPLITSLQNQLASEEINVSGMRRQFTQKYPGLIAEEAKIQETKRRLDAELSRSLQVDHYGVDPVYQQLAQQLRQDEVVNASYDAREGALTAAIQEYGNKLRQLPARELEQVRLARQAKDAETVDQILSDKLQQARIAEASIGSAVRVVDPAKVPPKPARSRSMDLILGGFLGLIVGTGGALVKEHFDDPMKSGEDAAQVLGVPILGLIPRLPRHPQHQWDGQGGAPPALTASPLWYLFPQWRPSAASLQAAARLRAAFVESFRYLRTNLLYLHKEPLRTLLVTSPGPGEGQDVVAANLAIALAQMGRRVWLMECDLRKPALDQCWALRTVRDEAANGLSDLLTDGLSVRQAVVRTGVENLWFLPAGRRPSHPAELLGSDRMRTVLQQAREEADVLVLLAPPVLPVSDAAVLASSVDGVLLVVKVGTTPREAAYRTQQQLQAVGARILGVAVTAVPTGVVGGYDRYYASYYEAEPEGPWHFGDTAVGAAPEPVPPAAAVQEGFPG
ncbi:MAG TPA: polysaccharide biosynthesis tyrosine autokinase [bacterium]|nr:polysaccharide biosynthesis tyrosine autokinase [bacterium]